MDPIKESIRKARLLLSQDKLGEAKVTLLNAYKRTPHDSGILLNLGIVHAREGDFDSAIRWMREALKEKPGDVDAHISMGSALTSAQKIEDAKEHYQTAIAIRPNSFYAHYYLAWLFVKEMQLEDAEFHFKYASQIKSSHADCHVGLAQVYLALNRLDEASSSANVALKLKDDHLGALVVLGKIGYREKHYGAAEKMFRHVLSSTTDELQAADTMIELALVFDKLGQFDNAYKAVSSGKATLSRLEGSIPFYKKELQKLVIGNKKWIVEKNVNKWVKEDDHADSRMAPIFFVGFPRSGTTLTEQILNQHPNIVTSNEMPFLTNVVKAIPALLNTDAPFPQSITEASNQDIARLRREYWNNVEAGIGNLRYGKQLVDKTPLNLIALGFIARLFPDARILVAIRDPRDVCLSCYMQRFQANIAMANFLSMESTVSFYAEIMSLWLHYRSVLDINWYQYRYEDLVDDFDTTTRSIFGFLKLDYPENAPEFHIAAKTRVIHSPSQHDVATPIYTRSKARWKNYNKYIARHMDKLAPFIDEFGYL